ncbi:hypothetical protein [Blastococcus brunescens]|uniref:DUF4190 domain-containing protein n=1 Tax=Blastococcus brunescens TaxID=1564165 RepID=A0ABZ1B6H8_9ACTN|nr:hypothetical protein [Blastococcus sp. BMG 8361]WRL66403.1 hypothetical protein U6N30_13795 [Blastococcus sp. BMG 8361]
MSTYRYKPSKPLAVFGAVFGAAIGGVRARPHAGRRRSPGRRGLAFLVLWCVAGLAIIGFNLWAAFARNGSLATFSRVPDDEDGPAR